MNEFKKENLPLVDYPHQCRASDMLLEQLKDKDKRIAELKGLLSHAGDIIQSLTSGTLTQLGHDEVYEWATWLLGEISERGADE